MQFLQEEFDNLRVQRYKDFKAITAEIKEVWKQINCEHEWEDASYQIGAAKVKRVICPKCKLSIYDETYEPECDEIIQTFEKEHGFEFTDIGYGISGISM